MGFFSKIYRLFFNKKTKDDLVGIEERNEARAIQLMKSINESLDTANKSSDVDVRRKKANYAHQKLLELEVLALSDKRISLQHADEVRAEIKRIKSEFTVEAQTSAQKKTKDSSVGSNLAKEQAIRLMELINESLEIAHNSSNVETRVSRVNFAEEKLHELQLLSIINPEITINNIDSLKDTIKRLKPNFTASVSFSSEDLLKNQGYLAEVNGEPTYKLSHMKQDLTVMQACADAESRNYWAQPEGMRLIAAPFFFERTAILQRRNKNYEAEIKVCEEWNKIVDDYKNQDYVKNGNAAKVWLGSTSIKINERLPRAYELLEREKSKTKE